MNREASEAPSESLLTRSVQDPIHGYITLSPDAWTFVDTKQFQRLRYIKQLGTSYFVWPGASHNRFEHCIGVAHLARFMVERLRDKQPGLEITERDVRCVELAGLCHDLGHGPFSHVWDGHYIPRMAEIKAREAKEKSAKEAKEGDEVKSIGRNPFSGGHEHEDGWTHEDASEMMLDDLVSSNDISISKEDVDFIKDLIKGEPKHTKNKNPPEKSFLFDIVANKRNGLDVDKFDYIPRDHHAVGEHTTVRAARLIKSARVINGQICYNIKDANQVYELCHTRFRNHRMIYSHKTAKAIEYMIVDALIAAEKVLDISGDVRNPKKFINLTDDIILRVERSTEPELAESCALLERVRTRKLYTQVDYTLVEYQHADRARRKITPAAIVRAAKSMPLTFINESMIEDVRGENDDGAGSSAGGKRGGRESVDHELVDSLEEDHVVVDFTTMHFGMKHLNPMEFVKFYGKHNINRASLANAADYSTILPRDFAESMVKIYTKDQRFYGIIQAGYRQILKTLQNDDSLDSPEAPFSSQSTVAAPPTTPRLLGNNTFDANMNTPAPSTRKLGRTDSTTSSTPFVENRFTEVPRNFQPPRSPTAKRIGRGAGGGSFNSTISDLSLDGSGSGKHAIAASSARIAPPPQHPYSFAHTPDDQKASAIDDNSDSTRPKAPTPAYIPSTPTVAKAQAEEGAPSAGAPSRLNVIEVPESPSRGRERRTATRKRDAESPENADGGATRKRTRRSGL